MRKICITGLLVAVSLLFACKNPSNSTVPENQNEATDSNSTENEKTPAAIVPTSKVQFNFSGAKAIAQLESVSDDSRAADDDNLGDIVKILDDGSMQNAITIGKDCILSKIVNMYKSPVEDSGDVYIVFDGESTIAASDDEIVKIGQLICVHSDGSIADILKKDGDEEGHFPLKADSLTFDSNGNLYFICDENGEVIYQYNPSTNDITKMVAAVENTEYTKIQIDKEGEWIYASGERGKAGFLRAIPVSNPNNFKNVYYSSGSRCPDEWVYDDLSKRVYFIASIGDKNGLFAASRGSDDTWLWGEHTVTGRERGLNDEEWTLFDGIFLKNKYRGYRDNYSNFYWAYSVDVVESSYNSENRRLSADEIITMLFRNANYNGMFPTSGYYGYTGDDSSMPSLAPIGLNIRTNRSLYGMDEGLIPSLDTVDLRFDAFKNESGAFKILYNLTEGKRNDEAVAALDNWLGKAALFSVLNDSRYNYEGYQASDDNYRLEPGVMYKYKNNFASDVLYVKGTDTLLKYSDEVILTYYETCESNYETYTYEFKDKKEVKGKDFFQKEGGYYIYSATPEIVYGHTVDADKYPSILCYSFTKEYSEILEYFYSFCGLKGEKEFRLTAFKDDEVYSSLYTNLTNEKALEWIEADLGRLSLFAKVVGLQLNYYWDDNNIYVEEKRIFNEPLIQFISKTCFIKGTEESAMAWNIRDNYEVNYWHGGSLFANDKGAYFEQINSQNYNLVSITEAEAYCRFPESVKKISFPEGRAVDSVRNNNFFLIQYALMNGEAETGFHHIYSVNLDSGEIKNCFDAVPNGDRLEVISFSSAGELLYYSAVRGTVVENGIVNIVTNEFNPLTVQRRMVAVYAF